MDERGTGLREQMAALRRYRLLIVASVLFATVGAVIYSYRGGPAFSASSRVVVRPVVVEGTLTPQDVFDAAQDPFGLSAPIDTQVQLVLGEPVAKRVAQILPPSIVRSASVSARAITDDVLEIDASAPDAESAIRVANGYASAFLVSRRDVVRDAFLNAVTDLDAKIDELTRRSDELAATIARAGSGKVTDGLRAELRSISETLGTLTSQRDERFLDAQSVTGGGEIVRSARAASASGPAPIRNGVVGILLGLALGFGLALLRANGDRRVFTLDAAAEATGADVLAAIPKQPALAAGDSDGAVQVSARGGGNSSPDDEGGDAESIRGELRLPLPVASSFSIFREVLIARGVGSKLRRIVLLSPEPGEGSELASAGLAWACARAGLNTVAVDGAVGPAEPQPLFGDRAHGGLGQALAGEISLTEALAPTSLSRLHVLPAGPPKHRHDDALASARLDALIHALERNADLLIIRSPALFSGGDAMAWAREADAILLVLRAGVSRPGAAARASRSLQSLGHGVLGVVLMDASARDGSVGLPEHVPSLEADWHGNGHFPVPIGHEPESAAPRAAPEKNPQRSVAARRRRH